MFGTYCIIGKRKRCPHHVTLPSALTLSNRPSDQLPFVSSGLYTSCARRASRSVTSLPSHINTISPALLSLVSLGFIFEPCHDLALTLADYDTQSLPTHTNIPRNYLGDFHYNQQHVSIPTPGGRHNHPPNPPTLPTPTTLHLRPRTPLNLPLAPPRRPIPLQRLHPLHNLRRLLPTVSKTPTHPPHHLPIRPRHTSKQHDGPGRCRHGLLRREENRRRGEVLCEEGGGVGEESR